MDAGRVASVCPGIRSIREQTRRGHGWLQPAPLPGVFQRIVEVRTGDLSNSVNPSRLLPALLMLTQVLVFVPMTCNAQLRDDNNTSTDVDSTNTNEARTLLRELSGTDLPAVADPLILSRMLIPGIGMQILLLGTSFDQVRLEYGPPIDETNTGLLGRTKNWLYRADDGTDIIVSGEDAVDEISLRGGANSTFMTREGLSFGMAALEITAFYGEPDNQDREKSFEYPRQGISFGLEAGQIQVIVLSAPEN